MRRVAGVVAFIAGCGLTTDFAGFSGGSGAAPSGDAGPVLDANMDVEAGTPMLVAPLDGGGNAGGLAPPSAGLRLWLSADVGVEVGVAGAVSAWRSRDPSGAVAAQSEASARPTKSSSAALVLFDTSSELLVDLPVNGAMTMTLAVVATSTLADDYQNGTESGALVWRETAGWGTVYLKPFSNDVRARAGTGKSDTDFFAIRSPGARAPTIAVLSHAAADELYLEGSLVEQRTDRGGALGPIGAQLHVGRGHSFELYEALVFTPALSASDLGQLHTYLRARYRP